MGTVTVTLRNKDYSSYRAIANVGDLIKIKKEKRLILIVTGYEQSEFFGTIFTKRAYQPAPKSQLLNKSVFSKFKKKIIPLTNPQL